ncbi:MAG: hypothetical protein D4R80_01965 [Deltaproteobacteria bacterium]|nr:MAG: hypothetical protein D4R80_01965 [Deltaproteobacteria bacterium]
MNTVKRLLALVLLLTGFLLPSLSSAEDVYYLKDGNRAVIVERQLFIYPPGSKRVLALPGNYPTRDGKNTIVVTGKSTTVVRNR